MGRSHLGGYDIGSWAAYILPNIRLARAHHIGGHALPRRWDKHATIYGYGKPTAQGSNQLGTPSGGKLGTHGLCYLGVHEGISVGQAKNSGHWLLEVVGRLVKLGWWSIHHDPRDGATMWS